MESKTIEEKSGLPLRIFRCDESAEYEKRVLAHTDVSFSLQCLLRLRDMNNNKNGDDVVLEALWNASIIILFSVFDGPNSLKLKILDELPEGAREVYKFFSNYRSKHIAHKVNPIDQIKAGVILSDPNAVQKEVLGIGNLAMNDASFADPELVDSLGKFIDALLKKIEKEIESWSKKTIEAAKRRNIDELYELLVLRVVVPGSGHLRKGT